MLPSSENRLTSLSHMIKSPDEFMDCHALCMGEIREVLVGSHAAESCLCHSGVWQLTTRVSTTHANRVRSYGLRVHYDGQKDVSLTIILAACSEDSLCLRSRIPRLYKDPGFVSRKAGANEGQHWQTSSCQHVKKGNMDL